MDIKKQQLNKLLNITLLSSFLLISSLIMMVIMMMMLNVKKLFFCQILHSSLGICAKRNGQINCRRKKTFIRGASLDKDLLIYTCL